MIWVFRGVVKSDIHMRVIGPHACIRHGPVVQMVVPVLLYMVSPSKCSYLRFCFCDRFLIDSTLYVFVLYLLVLGFTPGSVLQVFSARGPCDTGDSARTWDACTLLVEHFLLNSY